MRVITKNTLRSSEVAFMTFPASSHQAFGRSEADLDTHQPLLPTVVELHLELTDSLPPFLHSAPNLRQEVNSRGLCLGEDIDVVCGRPPLSDENPS